MNFDLEKLALALVREGRPKPCFGYFKVDVNVVNDQLAISVCKYIMLN